jgi:pimeloyl-ACP methyl ester carboxylesterase
MVRQLLRCLLATSLLTASATVTSAQTPSAPTAEAVTLPRDHGQLVGTLLIPHSTSPVPVVLLIAGSGPTDRDGNGPGFTPASLRQLAESLATRGIATLRYDKRGIAGSASAMGSESDLRFEMYADDAAGWIGLLKADRRFSRVIVAGHSEGALLGLLALRRSKAAGYISLEGPARPANEVLHDQLARQLTPALLSQSDTILARLTRGESIDSTPPVLAALFRPSVQPYLISWFKYSAATELAQLDIPCLIVQGTHDVQVDTTEADLLHRANPRCTMARIEGMNHVLKMTPADMASQMPSYRGPDAPLSGELVQAVTAFVTAVGK